MAIAGKVGAVYRTTGEASVAFTDEATIGNTTHKRYSIANAAKRFWDTGTAPTVKVNGETVTSGYTIEYAGGVVVFEAALLQTDTVTVSGKNYAIEQCATLFDWKLDAETNLKTVTTFASNGWEEQHPVSKGWSAGFNGYWADESFAGLLGKQIAVSLFIDATTNKRYEGYVYLKKNGIEEKVDDVVKESVEITGTGTLYYHE